MPDKVSISFTGTIERLKTFDRSTKLTVAIDEGREYPARVDVWIRNTDAERFRVNDEIEVDCDTMPYASAREHNGKIYKDVNVNPVSIRHTDRDTELERELGGKITDEYPGEPMDEDIPF